MATPEGTLKQVGETLRQKRKEMNLSLKEVENATSIRINHLTAIEEGDLNKLISPVYAQGFVKQYATFLGMDGEEIVRQHPETFSRKLDKQEFSYGIGTLEMRGNPAGGVKIVPNLLWVVAFAAILALAWFMAKYLSLF